VSLDTRALRRVSAGRGGGAAGAVRSSAKAAPRSRREIGSDWTTTPHDTPAGEVRP
jgi:hypothetical protein